MRIILFIVTLSLFLVLETNAQKKAFNDSWDGNFDVMNVPEAKNTPNIVTLKATGIGKTREEATAKSKRNAVSAVMFRGIPGSAVASPLLGSEVNTLHDQYKSLFDEFFAPKGDYSRFVNMPGDVDPKDIVAVKKVGYEVAATCQVNYDELRKYLEDKQIIRKFGQF